jgi:hypothetical protein
VVRDCDFGFNRSRGIIAKASHGTISGNKLDGCWMPAILVSPEAWWFEATQASDLTIASNKISRCRQCPINVESTGLGMEPLAAGSHTGLRIVGNIIADCAYPSIRVTSTLGLVIMDNQFLPSMSASNIVLDRCQDARIQPLSPSR